MLEAIGERVQDIYFKKVWGITREYPELKWSGATIFLAYSMYDQWKHDTEIRGHFPPVGKSAIGISNHGDKRDPVKAVSAFRKFGRTIRCFARDSLLDPSIKEDPQVLAATGKLKNDLDNTPLWLRRLRAKSLRDTGSIALKRGNKRPLRPMRIALSAIDRGNFVASFLQWTRIPEGDLRDLFEGAAFLAYQRPDTLIIPIGNSSNPDLFNIGEWYSYRQAKSAPGFDIEGLEKTQNLTIYMAGTVAPLLPSELTDRWFDGQRGEAIKKFKAKNETDIQLRKERLRVKREVNPQN